MPRQWHQVKPNNFTDYREMLENSHIGGWDLKGKDGKFRDFTLTIASVEEYKPKRLKKGEQISRFTIFFVEAEKPWLCGKTSGRTIKAIYGAPRNWPGKRITIYFDQDVTFGREKTGGVRVRPTAPPGSTPVQELESQPVDPEMRERQNRAASLAEQLDEGGEWGDTGSGVSEPAPREPGQDG
jgi:hypothetical protein